MAQPGTRGAVQVGDVIAVTGASGYIGSHICKSLLERGFKVRAVVRNKDDPTKVGHLQALATGLPAGTLTFYNGDLSAPGSYDEAFEGADGVVHAAAVVEINSVDDPEKQIVAPSIEGTRNVLNSLDKSSTVKRVIQTSSVAAINTADRPNGTVFTEKDWNTYSTVANGDAYGYAKTQAERLVEEHVGKGTPYDFAAVNPGIVLGPCLAKAHTKASAIVVRQMLYGNEQPAFYAPLVDVREVAVAHVEALLRPEASGQRFILVEPSPTRWLTELGPMLQQLFPQYLIVARSPAWYKLLGLRVLTVFGLGLSLYQQEMLTKRFMFDSRRAIEVLGIHFRSMEETLRDTVESMVAPGWIKPVPRA
eukprot:GGOE01011069.1.p2 GENE.GGOE01011069.1~~GGOE01011069.1.p2  ORF type:complete len:371 (-),score=102.58 GGOE01011069.1:452-1540(-)